MEEVEKVKILLCRYKVLGAASLQKVRASQLQELRRKLEGKAHLLVTKNTIMKRAVAKCKDKPRLVKFEEHLRGTNIFLFTDINPFKLALLLERNKVKAHARAGDMASDEVVVSAGNTGQPPGPFISQLSAVGLPSRIESGSVWITKDTVAARKGAVITERLASVLSKLGIKSVEVGLTMKVAYDDGVILTKEDMHLNLEKIRQDLFEAQTLALNLSINAVYPISENVVKLLQLALKDARGLSINACIPTSDTMPALLQKAHLEMLSLSTRITPINERSKPRAK
jgi:large subunit ribosomal protein L10